MNLSEAQAIVSNYGYMSYLSKSHRAVLANAKAVIKTAAEMAMNIELAGLCTRCGGDGFHRVNDALLSGACEVCKGKGTLVLTGNDRVPPASEGAK